MVNFDKKTTKQLKDLRREKSSNNNDECPFCGAPKVDEICWGGTGHGENCRAVFDCDCRDKLFELISNREAQEEEAWKINRLLRDHSGVPEAYKFCSIADFKPQNESQKKALKISERYVEKWGKVQNEGLGIIFSGGVGVGKTHLAITILKELTIREKISGKFITLERWFSKLKGAMDYNETTQEDLISPLEEREFVVLDELAVDYISTWEEKTLRRVIDYRVKNNKPLVLTTNDSVKDIKEHLGPRLYSRLRGKTGAIEMKGKDMRAQEKVDLNETLKTGGKNVNET